MLQYGIKVIVTAILVVCISEAAKRWTFLGAVIASLPLTSVLAMIWLYIDTRSVEKVSELSWGIFWIAVPSLIFFILFPTFAKIGWRFWPSLGTSVLGTAIGYLTYIKCLGLLGVKF